MEIEFRDGLALKTILTLIQCDNTDELFFHLNLTGFALAWESGDNHGRAIIKVENALLATYLNDQRECRIISGEFY